METPEGRVKKRLRAYLVARGDYQHWPVPRGYGGRTTDVLVCHEGQFEMYEAKKDASARPTALQRKHLEDVVRAGGRSWVVYLNESDILVFETVTLGER